MADETTSNTATYRKREAENKAANLKRAVQHVTMFWNSETGGDAMLASCATTDDHRLRRDIGVQIGRMIALIEEGNDVKKLVAVALGCRNWRAQDAKIIMG